MTAIITQKYRQYLARLFKEDLDDLSIAKNLYLFIGKFREWEVDEVPPFPRDTVLNEYRIWDEMIALKKVKEVDSSYVVPRFDYDESGETVYVPFSDDDTELYVHPTPAEIAAGQLAPVPYVAGSMYVMTNDYHVFKCLGNAGGAKSTVKPVKPLSAPFIYEGADGYQWKYMFTVSGFEIERYLTDEWMPLKTLAADDGSDQWLVQQNATSTAGRVQSVRLISGGSGYFDVQDADPDNPDTQLVVSATATTVTLSLAASVVNNAYTDCTIWIVNGTGAGQTRRISTYVGATREATVTDPWTIEPDATSEYQVLPSLDITGDGTGLLLKPVVVAGVITRVIVVDTGQDYRSVAVAIAGASGSGAEIVANLSPRQGHGADALEELGGSFVMLSVELEFDEGAGDFPVTNDYRVMGLLKDVLDLSSSIATADTLIAAKKIEHSGTVGAFISDEVITGGTSGAQAFIIQPEDLGGGDGTITFAQTEDTGFTAFAAGETITGANSGASAVIDTIVPEEVQKHTGDLLYFEQRRPIMRAPDQKETIKLVSEF